MDSDGERINKFLSACGVCSRREADREIAAGHVLIDGRPAGPGDRVLPGMTVVFRGEPVRRVPDAVLIAYNKPVGVVCTTDRREPDNIIDRIGYPERIYPVGRLDKSSEGLILLTNQGDIVNRIMRARNCHEKEYDVTVDRDLTQDFLAALGRGIYLEELGVTTRPCRVKKTGRRRFTIVLTQGLNRQIRRMCETYGYRVRRLVRVRIMNIELGDLAPGTYRSLTSRERKELDRMTADSGDVPAGGK